MHAPGGRTCCEIYFRVCNNRVCNNPLFEEGYQPEIVANFPDERSCSNFKLAIVASRDSLNVTTTTTEAAAAISKSMDYRSHDFEWSASDNPSEITYLPKIMYCLCICLFHGSPCIAYAIYNSWKFRSSQRVKITDTQIDFEHISPRSCCCLHPESKRTYHINLNDVRMIHKFSEHLIIYYFVGAGKSKQSAIGLGGFVDSSNTPRLIKDAIVQRRPKQPQTTRYTIPHITNTHKSQTITLNPDTVSLSVDYNGRFVYVSFIDGLGSIDMQQGVTGDLFAGSHLLRFWSPPVGRPRGGSKDGPEMFVMFPDDRSCLAFKHAVESSRNSFQCNGGI
jgi:hypothetical protein